MTALQICTRCGEERACKPEGPEGELVCLVCAIELTPGIIASEYAARNAGERCVFEDSPGHRCSLRAGHDAGHVGGLAFYELHGASSSSSPARRPYEQPRINSAPLLTLVHGGRGD